MSGSKEEKRLGSWKSSIKKKANAKPDSKPGDFLPLQFAATELLLVVLSIQKSKRYSSKKNDIFSVEKKPAGSLESCTLEKKGPPTAPATVKEKALKRAFKVQANGYVRKAI